MTANARISPNWAIRLFIAGVAFIGFGCWSLYDGKIKYPEQERTFQAYHAEGKLEEFRALAGKNKWKVEIHQDADGNPYVRGPWDIRTQFIMATVCLPIGLLLLGRLILTFPRRLEADEDGFTSAKGIRIPYRAVTAIDKKKWNRKGIAVVHYDENGKAGKAVIDDWIFKGGADILRMVEEHVPPEISGLSGEEEQAELEEQTVEGDRDGTDTDGMDPDRPVSQE